MNVSWLLETDKMGADAGRLAAEARRQGMDVQIADRDPFGRAASLTTLFPAHACVVCYGSLDFAEQVRRETNWVPAAYANWGAYNCSYYYPLLGPHLLAQEYCMLPYGDLLRRRDWLYEHLGRENVLFLRPDSGRKLFTGQLVCREHFDTDIPRLGPYNPRTWDLVVASPPCNLDAEWRLVVIDREVVASSMYRCGDQKCEENGCWPAALEFGRAVAAGPYQPARAWILDICRTVAGNFYVMEPGSVSCAGYYACDLEPVVRELSRVALEEWREVNEP